MANQYGLSSYASRLDAAAAAADPYHYDSTLAAATSRYPSAYAGAAAGYGGADGLTGSSLADSLGVKRQLEALYHQNVFGTHNTIGQSDDLYSQNSLVKCPRYDSASYLPVFPQRPGEKDCTHYMLTRTCKFGERCKFDHPLWVPEGGIPDWKEVPVPTAEVLPERPGEPDCPYFLKTTKCKFGFRCKFNHPKALLETCDAALLPDRPSEPLCSYYAKTGKCQFGANCIFHHPKDIQISQPVTKNSDSKVLANANAVAGGNLASGNVFVPPALLHNTKGLPIRIGEQDCPFYLKTGSCKYGPTCRFNHPDRPSIPSVDSALANTLLQNHVLSAAASLLPNIDPRLTQTTLGALIIYPQRPGELECDYYMKNGLCKFGDRCKFHHPINRTMPTVNKQDAVKFTLAGLPRREGAIMCPFYMKTGICKFGATCKYDHPPPGEVMSTNQSGLDTDGNAVDTGAASES